MKTQSLKRDFEIRASNRGCGEVWGGVGWGYYTFSFLAGATSLVSPILEKTHSILFQILYADDATILVF